MTAFSSNGPHDDARCVQQKFVKNALYFIICMFVRTYVCEVQKHYFVNKFVVHTCSYRYML